MNVLIINAGSSSLKYQLMDPESGEVSAKGLCERIYIDGRLTHKVGDKKVVKDIPMPTHSEAIAAVLDILVDPVDGVIKSVDFSHKSSILPGLPPSRRGRWQGVVLNQLLYI